jgi:hypothetical protein
MSEATSRRAKTAALLGAGVAAGVIAAWALSSNAQGNTPSGSGSTGPPATAAPSTRSAPNGQTPPMRPMGGPMGRMGDHDGDHDGRPGRPGGQNPDETVLSGSRANTLKAAALKQVPGGTVRRVETDSGDAAYEVHMTDKDGKPVTVKFDKNLKFVAVEDGMGK